MRGVGLVHLEGWFVLVQPTSTKYTGAWPVTFGWQRQRGSEQSDGTRSGSTNSQRM